MTVVKQTLNDGPRNYIIKVDVAGANTDEVLVDVSALANVTLLRVVEVQWSLVGAEAVLEWDATSDVQTLVMGQGTGFFVGIVPNNGGSGVTGDLTLTNSASVTNGTILIKCKKS